MLIAIVPSVLGFILIFVAFRGNSQPGLIVLGVSDVHVIVTMSFNGVCKRRVVVLSFLMVCMYSIKAKLLIELQCV